MGDSFVGTLLIAAATSLPELVVAISALRLRAVEMAFAGLLGSNLFDVLILAIDDLAYSKGSLLAAASPAHAGSALIAAIMSGIVIVGLLYRPKARFFGIFTWISMALLVLYLMSSYAIFLHGT
jgi:cation:H+ antiporter